MPADFGEVWCYSSSTINVVLLFLHNKLGATPPAQ